MANVLLSLLLAAAAPGASTEHAALALELAGNDPLMVILPMIEAKETAELLAEDKTLTPEQQAVTKASAHRIYMEGRTRLLNALANQYAKALSTTDMRRLVSFQRTPAARHMRQAMPQIAIGAMSVLGEVDFKGAVRKDVCKQTGKLCGAN